MKKIYYRKLIRDKIPATILKNGGSLEYKILDEKAFECELIKKVEEEASALPKVKTRRELIAELADVVAVIEEIKKVKKIKAKELRQALRQNEKHKGGFKKKYFLVWSEDTGYRTNERRNVRGPR